MSGKRAGTSLFFALGANDNGITTPLCFALNSDPRTARTGGGLADWIGVDVTDDTRDASATMLAAQALNLANHPMWTAAGGAAPLLARIWGRHDHALADAEHLLASVLDDQERLSIESLYTSNALALIRQAQRT